MMEQVMKGQTIRVFQKTYTEVVLERHATELEFLQQNVNFDNKDYYQENPVHELHDYYSVRTYLCHYLKFCKKLCEKDQKQVTPELCKDPAMYCQYLIALKNWAEPRSGLEKVLIFAAAVIKAVRAMYQVYQMNEETF